MQTMSLSINWVIKTINFILFLSYVVGIPSSIVSKFSINSPDGEKQIANGESDKSHVSKLRFKEITGNSRRGIEPWRTLICMCP